MRTLRAILGQYRRSDGAGITAYNFSRGLPVHRRQPPASKYQHSPLDYLLSVLNNPASSPERKMYAAEKAAPYVHPKLANTTSKIGTDEPIEIKVQWQKES